MEVGNLAEHKLTDLVVGECMQAVAYIPVVVYTVAVVLNLVVVETRSAKHMDRACLVHMKLNELHAS